MKMDVVLRKTRKRGFFLAVLLVVSGCGVHPTVATDEPLQPNIAPAERLYANPVYRWSISYPSSWTVDSGDLGSVKISSSADQALCGIHSGEVQFRTVDEYTNALEPATNRVVLARRKISLPNDVIGNDVLSLIVGGGKSRRIYILANGRAFGIDCETYEKNWDRLEPLYDRIIKSFTLGK